MASPAGCRTLASAAEAARLAGGDRFAWIDLEETGDAGMRQISEVLGLGAETLEVLRRADQRPRFMPLAEATYAAVPEANPSASSAGRQEYVCLALTERFLLTRHSTPNGGGLSGQTRKPRSRPAERKGARFGGVHASVQVRRRRL